MHGSVFDSLHIINKRCLSLTRVTGLLKNGAVYGTSSKVSNAEDVYRVNWLQRDWSIRPGIFRVCIHYVISEPADAINRCAFAS